MRKASRQPAPTLMMEILLAACVCGLTGHVWLSQSKNAVSPVVIRPIATPTAGMPSADAQSGLYAGWTAYELKNEKVKFQYPPSWKLQDLTATTSQPVNSKGQPAVTPGSDTVTLTSPSGLAIKILTAPIGYDPTNGNPRVATIASVPLTMLGASYSLNFLASAPGQPAAFQALVMVAASSNFAAAGLSVVPPAKNIAFGWGAADLHFDGPIADVISLAYTSGVAQPPAQFMKDPQYANAIGILQSMTY